MSARARNRAEGPVRDYSSGRAGCDFQRRAEGDGADLPGVRACGGNAGFSGTVTGYVHRMAGCAGSTCAEWLVGKARYENFSDQVMDLESRSVCCSAVGRITAACAWTWSISSTGLANHHVESIATCLGFLRADWLGGVVAVCAAGLPDHRD